MKKEEIIRQYYEKTKKEYLEYEGSPIKLRIELQLLEWILDIEIYK